MNVAAIPAELRERRQWVTWRVEERDGKQTKPPRRVDGGGYASADDPATWGDFDEALATLEAGAVDGIGFVFAADDPFAGVDLDDCRNGSGLHPDAAAILLKLDSYAEWSPSGQGVHVLVRGQLPGSRRRKGQVELYDRARFFTVTDEHIRGCPETVEERQAELELIYRALLSPEPTPPRPAAQPVDADDEEILRRARSARNGAAFERLWQGDTTGHGSHSEADLALCGLLAFWTGPDPARIDALFRRSGLMRAKWDSRRGESSYGAQTVEKSLAGRTDFYSPSSSRPGRDAVGTRSFSPDAVSVDLRFVTASAFSAVDEPGAEALVGADGNVLVPEGGDVMFYGDGGAGKTTLMIDLGLHLAAGEPWLGIAVIRVARVAIIENEGPRPLFRAKLRRKLDAWKGAPLEDRLLLLEDPWSRVSLDEPAVRKALAEKVAELELDALLVGPVTRSGMNEAGTLQQVRDYANLLAEVRAASGRRVTFLLAHHENRGGQVSGAWEGAVDTLFHVQAQGNGQTRLYVQKARWSPEHHKQKIQLAWSDGEGFDVIESEERDDNVLADEILAYVREHGGTGWNKVDDAVAGKGDRLRAIRDSLLAGGRLVNRVSEARMKLWHAGDPALPPENRTPGLLEDAEA